MAEVTGIQSENPNNFTSESSSAPSSTKNESSKISSSAIMGPLEDIVRLLSVNNEQSELTNIAFQSSVKELQEIKTVIQTNDIEYLTSITANTAALVALASKLDSTEITYNVSSDDGSFFSKFLAVATNEKKTIALSKFSEVFTSTVESVAKLTKHSKKIDELGESLLKFFGSAKVIGKTLALAAAGLALFGLALITVVQAITVGDLLMFVGIMAAIRIGSELLGDANKNFLMSAAGIALVGLAIWAFTELITFDMATSFAGSLLVIGAAMWGFSKLSSGVGKNSKGVMMGAAAIAAVAGALWLFNKAISDFEDFDLAVATKTIIATGLAAGLFYFIGKGATQIAMGSAAAAAVGAGLWALAQGVGDFLSISFDPEQAWKNAAAAGIAIGVLGLIGGTGVVAIAIGLGAAAAAAVGAALWVLAKGINAIATVNVTEEQAQRFATSLGLSVEALLSAFGPINSARLVLATPVAMATVAAVMASVVAMRVVASMPEIKEEKFILFGKNINHLVDSYASIGIIQGGAATAGSALMVLISGATVLTATAIRVITTIMPNSKETAEAVNSMGIFIDSFTGLFSNKETDFSAIKNGIASFGGVATLAKDIADTVMEIGNLQFVSKEYRNGKFVITGSRKVTEKDFKQVGVSMGQMLSALTEPLAAIGGSQDTFSIGGFTITNPFSNKVQNGIEAMSGIGKVFFPISDIIKTFASNGVDKNYITTFNKNLSLILGGVAEAFILNADPISKASSINIFGITKGIGMLTNLVSNDKFAGNVENFSAFTGDVVKVKDALNSMDIEKLGKFNVMLKQLNDMAKVGAMQELVSVFKEFIEKFSEFADNAGVDVNVNTTTTSSGLRQALAPQSFGQPIPLISKPETTTTKQQPMDMSAMIKELAALSSMFKTGTAKVKLQESYS